MVSKSVLKQYIDLKEEIKELKEKIKKINKRKTEIDKEICELKMKKRFLKTQEGTDFFTNNILLQEIDIMIDNLFSMKSSYCERKVMLISLSEKISNQISEIQKFEEEIDDVLIKQIFDFRIKQGLTWRCISMKMGSVNSEYNLRVMFDRYLKKKSGE